MQDTKNLIFAVVLSTLILFCWQYFYAGPKIAETQRIMAAQQAAKKAENLSVPSENSKAAEPTITNTTVFHDRSELLNPSERVKISTGKFHGSIALKGARFDDLTLAEYKETTSPDSKEVVLLSPTGSDDVYFAEFGWVAANHTSAMPTAQTVWKADSQVLTAEKPVTLSWDNGSGLKFFNVISVDENYMFTITRRVENYGKATESLLPYGVLNRAKAEEKHTYAILHEGPLGVLDGVLDEIRYKDLKKEQKREIKSSKGGWIGITDKYWLTAIIPDQKESFDANFNYFNTNSQNRYQADYLEQKYDIGPNEKAETTSHFFAGVKQLNMLDNYGKNLGIPLFDRAVDFGRLYFITKPIFELLAYFNHLLGNFGLAILLLTILVKSAMFPLANKSYVSMHHLKRLQPQITEIKERYKNDKAQMNKVIMELYKAEKVNPMAGCLPLIIQIPVFFALYKVLFITIEMRQAPFYGWIKDLSMPDPTSVFNLFGLLPFTPPPMLMIGAWPLIMGLTMFLQQKMNPKPADPVQAKVMQMLPFIFVFMFNTFPAGLIIYWAWNNTLSVLQQWVITRRLPQ
jgi:YidC/Oxa1 family membrane protein insertase